MAREIRAALQFRKDVARAFERLGRFMVWTVGLAVLCAGLAPVCITLEVVGNMHTCMQALIIIE